MYLRNLPVAKFSSLQMKIGNIYDIRYDFDNLEKFHKLLTVQFFPDPGRSNSFGSARSRILLNNTG
jgi:hypothetical protein